MSSVESAATDALPLASSLAAAKPNYITEWVVMPYRGRCNGSVGDADGVAYGVGLLEHGQHQVGDVWSGDDQAVAYVAVYRGPVCAGERSVGEAWWPDRGPVQAPVA